MNIMALMYVTIGGAVGSLARYMLTSGISRFNTGEFPLGTLAVNVLGGFLMGVWIAIAAYTMPGKAKDLHLLLAVGMLGGFTTFSAFSLDVFFLAERGLMLQVILYVTGSVLCSVLALVAGMYAVKLALG